MTTTIELIEGAEMLARRFSSDTLPMSAKLATDIAQRLRELDAQVADLELKLLTERGAKAWKDVPDATAFVEELRGNTDKPDCVWTNSDSDEEFETQCGNAFTFIDGGIKENDCKFCQYCGGAVKEVT